MAQQLHATIDEFDVDKLTICKPTALKVKVPDSLRETVEGRFLWFGEQQHSESAGTDSEPEREPVPELELTP